MTEAVVREFTLDVRRSHSETVISVAGELDAFSCPELKAVLNGIEGPGRVVVDVSAMTFIDSSALCVLIGAARRLASAGGGLVVRHPRRPALRVFELTATLEVLGVEE